MKNLIFLISIALLFSYRANAQEVFAEHTFDNNLAKDFTFGEYDNNALNMLGYDKDPSAQALVLKEFGRAWITSNGSVATLIFEYHVRVKLFNNEALKRGHIEIPYYIRNNGSYEEIRTSSVEAITYYKEPNGAMHAASVNPDSINIVKVNKHLNKVVFNMTHLQSGCIIEYRYRLESPFLEKFKTWEFQSDIPKIYSEYEVHIPTVFGYNVSLRGSLKLTKDTTGIEKECFESTNIKSDCTVEDYEISNVPAFKPEPYITSRKNYLSALYFQLTQYESINNFTNLNQAWHLDIASDWSDVDKTLKYNDNFGSQLNRGSLFKDRLSGILEGKTGMLARARAIYAYIQKNIDFNGTNAIYSEDGIKKALDKHTGNSADINLALVAALNEAGITAGAVLISTRDNGTVNKLYPALSEFNYVIAAVNIAGTDYLLDATEPQLQFGVLPLRCLNGPGRVVPLDKPSYWINVVTPQKQTDVYTIDVTLTDAGKLTGTIVHNSKGYAAFLKRTEIASFKAVDDYIKNINILPGMHISNLQINNADSLDMPLTETYQVEGNIAANSFSPVITDAIINPFTAATRTYDIDFGMPLLNSYTLTLHLPAGKTIGPLPNGVHSILPNDGGELNTSYELNGNTLIYTRQYQLNKPVYSIAEYPGLKAFFEAIVSAERTELNLTNK